MARVHGLVALTIRGSIVALHVWGQRHVPDRPHGVDHRLAGRRVQADDTTAVEVLADDLGLEVTPATVEHHAATGPEALAGMHERHPGVGVRRGLDEKAFGGAATGQAAADQPRGKDPRVVHHQEVARDQQRRQVVELMVRHHAIGAVQLQKPRSAPLRRWFLGNAFRRQVEIEIRDAHAPIVADGRALSAPSPWISGAACASGRR